MKFARNLWNNLLKRFLCDHNVSTKNEHQSLFHIALSRKIALVIDVLTNYLPSHQ